MARLKSRVRARSGRSSYRYYRGTPSGHRSTLASLLYVYCRGTKIVVVVFPLYRIPQPAE
jgi:hypothetical protein